jgi:hypothetical protein
MPLHKFHWNLNHHISIFYKKTINLRDPHILLCAFLLTAQLNQALSIFQSLNLPISDYQIITERTYFDIIMNLWFVNYVVGEEEVEVVVYRFVYVAV